MWSKIKKESIRDENKKIRKIITDIRTSLKFDGCLHCGRLDCRSWSHKNYSAEIIKNYRDIKFSDKGIEKVFKDRLFGDELGATGIVLRNEKV